MLVVAAVLSATVSLINLLFVTSSGLCETIINL